MVFTSKLQPISPPDLAYYGNDWKKYLEHYKLYAAFVSEHPESALRMTLETKSTDNNYVRGMVAMSKSPVGGPTLPPSVVRKRDHGQVERSPECEAPDNAPITRSRSPSKERPVAQVDFSKLRQRAPSQETIELPKKPVEAEKAKTPNPVVLPKVPEKAHKRAKNRKPLSPEERGAQLASMYMDKANGVLHESDDRPSNADCYLYLGKYLCHDALNVMTREDRLPKTYRALNNLADQCERLGKTGLRLYEIPQH